MEVNCHDFVRWFHDVSLREIALVGGKNASLGELIRELSAEGIPVPNGFALTSTAYRYFLEYNHLGPEIRKNLALLQVNDQRSLTATGAAIRSLMLKAQLPPEISKSIVSAYRELIKQRGGLEDVAVRSSATAEDLPKASFAGQQETFLNVHGEEAVLDACHRSYASLFTDRAISYRVHHGFDHLQVALSVGIQAMVRSDLSVSGVMFTIDTESGFPDVVLINGSYGLGENIVQGSVDPDEWLVAKAPLSATTRPIVKRQCGSKKTKFVYKDIERSGIARVEVSAEEQQRLCLTDDEVLTLSRWGSRIEQHYSKLHGTSTPMDIEWAKDGRTGQLFILQARPETVHRTPTKRTLVRHSLRETGELLLTGCSVGNQIGSGPVRIIKSPSDLTLLEPGEVLVADRTDPDWEPAMKRASAVVTNTGGRTCHAAIVSREFGIPALVGATGATQCLRDGDVVTVSCAEGRIGKLYRGKLASQRSEIDLKTLPQTNTKLMINLGDPDHALAYGQLPHQGVGLARMEFIISGAIGIHPLALCDFAELREPLRSEVEAHTVGYKDKSMFFVEKLSEGIGLIATAAYPHDVIVRFSDFKSNEYANLLGGELYEPKEENPMLGFRGASRYYHPRYERGFALECQSIEYVRSVMGLTNVKVMIPFCRTVEEGRRVLETMRRYGLERGKKGLEVYLMCEIPSNVILAEAFAELCDGFSIGSNDLTQLILGVDRDSASVAGLFDERNEAVVTMIGDVITRVKKCGKKIGICGQAPSDYPEFTRFLVERGIDSISLNPDALIPMLEVVSSIERQRTQALPKAAVSEAI